MILNWTEYLPFPDPRKQKFLYAPYGPGVYELKNIKTDELVLVGESKNLSYRMSSLLPRPFGIGVRNNLVKREYIWDNINSIQYRTIACTTKEEAKRTQDHLLRTNSYIFKK